MGRLTRHQVQHRENKTQLIQRRYSYNANGNLEQIEDLKKGTTRYQYDALDRLKTVEGYINEQFSFDPAGNLLDGQSQTTGNRLTFHGDRHFEYDQAGNLIREKRGKGGKLETRYTYNKQNQLIVVKKDGQRVEYQYDALGRRISKQDAFGKTEFLWNGDILLSEQRKHQQKLYLYEPNTFRPLAQIEADQVYHYHLDHLGTPQELTNHTGRVVWSARYKAYGNVALKDDEEIENNLRFQGQYFDGETGLHYNRFRYYDPKSARFISIDPLGIMGGHNNYEYATNPIMWIDPYGLVADCEDKIRRRANRESQTIVNGKEIRGFRNAGEVLERSGYLKNQLAKLGIDDAKIGIRGSSVSGQSSKGGSYRIERGELKASDVDFFFTSEKLERRFAGYFTPDGRLKPDMMEKLDPELQEVLDEFGRTTSTQLGRKADAVLLKRSVLETENPNDFTYTRK
ncbi:hypothetical protein OLMES_1336 [Oleiphilus messinensis]|uniref:Teneurin-like YD-shell domain-containing protein n=1 Tax=Oleiphilus messinensis TaxID=141451 RepID=A0A1Y0I7J9_9GAMM|nr:RHS repeat-associated core domain-containing protein [Oleiphilus messinensis]ARU55414.1 hypothetical protein OLMES_1336 [Oleiphilus messinensis]